MRQLIQQARGLSRLFLKSLPELALIGGTRVALGAGLGFLLTNKLSYEQRRALGWALLLVGAIATILLAIQILGKNA